MRPLRVRGLSWSGTRDVTEDREAGRLAVRGRSSGVEPFALTSHELGDGSDGSRVSHELLQAMSSSGRRSFWSVLPLRFL